MKRIEKIEGTFGVVEVKGGYVIARKLHKCHGTGTVVFEAQDRHGKLHKGTKSQIAKVCQPYSNKAEAEAKLSAAATADIEEALKAKRSEAAKKAAATRAAKKAAEAEAAAAAAE